MQTHPEIPNLKIAKVGKNRRRDKGGALPWWLGGAKGSALFGGAAAGGLSRAGGLASLGAKFGVTSLIAALCAGAYGVGVSLRPDEGQFAAHKKPRAFADAHKPKYEGDLSKLPATAKTTADSVGMVAGSLDGKTPEERAAEAAQAEAAAKAEREKAAQAEAALPEAPAPDAQVPADMAAAPAPPETPPAEAGKKPGFFSKVFGSLTQSLGSNHSGLAGGAGLSGGVGRSFDSPQITSVSGRLGAFPGSARAGVAQARSARVGQGSRRGAIGQLKKASLLSGLARRDAGEGSSMMARQAFEGAAAAPDSAITGAGAGKGKAGLDQTPDANPPPSLGGGPTEGGQYAGDNASPPAAPAGKNVTKWQGLANMVPILLMIATVLMGIAFILGQIAKSHPAIAATLYSIAKYLCYAAAAVAAMVTLMGMMILGMGQTKQGLIYTLTGAVVTAAAFIASERHAKAETLADKATQPAVQQVGSQLTPHNAMNLDMNGLNPPANTTLTDTSSGQLAKASAFR